MSCHGGGCGSLCPSCHFKELLLSPYDVNKDGAEVILIMAMGELVAMSMGRPVALAVGQPVAIGWVNLWRWLRAS